MITSRILTKLRRRLERAELDLLRQVSVDQSTRIEALEAELAEAHRAAAWAEDRAEMFQALAHDLGEQTDAVIGITRSGEVGLVNQASAH